MPSVLLYPGRRALMDVNTARIFRPDDPGLPLPSSTLETRPGEHIPANDPETKKPIAQESPAKWMRTTLHSAAGILAKAPMSTSRETACVAGVARSARPYMPKACPRHDGERHPSAAPAIQAWMPAEAGTPAKADNPVKMKPARMYP